jgi:DNA-directed RNA polymerase delta subunit
VEKEEIRDVILDSMVVSLEAQLRALKKLRGASDDEEPRNKSMSNLDMVFNILNTSGAPLHISQIIADAEKTFGVKLERESLVSALSKKIQKEERFVRTGKNTFALKAR